MYSAWQVDLTTVQGSPWGILFKMMHQEVAGALGRACAQQCSEELVENADSGIKPLSPFLRSSPVILLCSGHVTSCSQWVTSNKLESWDPCDPRISPGLHTTSHWLHFAFRQ